MARFCSKCNRKIGFFEEDFEGICKSCYEENLRKEERRIQDEKFRKIIEDRVEKEKQDKKEQREEQEEKREKEREEQRKCEKEQQEKLNKLKDNKKELLKNKLISNPMILDRFNNMINMTPIGVYGALKKENKSLENDGYLSEILFELLVNLYCEIPDDFKFNDIDKINNYKFLIKTRIELNEFFKENVNEKYFKNKKEDYNKIVCEYYNCEKFLFANSNIYIYHELHMNEDSKWADYGLSGTEYLSESDMLERMEVSKNMRILVYFKEIFSYAITVFYGLIFSKNMEIIENNEELNKIYNNLKSTTDDMEYISNKLYEMYKNFYKDLFDIPMFPKNFYNLVYLFKWKESYNYKYLKDNEYEDIINELKNNEAGNKTQIIIDKIKQSKCISYLEELGNDKKSACKILLIDTVARVGKCLCYDDLFLFLKDVYKNAEKLSEFADKQIAIKEKERLLNGNMNKEIEKEQLEVDYSNVQNGYEFEEYIANLYRKLGYKIEEVTKKSGDQGADVITYKDNVKYVIQVKFYNNPVGNKAVQEAVGAIGMYKADKGIVVTNSTFTTSAIELAQANHIELVDGEKIEEYKKEIVRIAKPNKNSDEENEINNIIEVWKVLSNGYADDDIKKQINCIGMSYATICDTNGENMFDENKVQAFIDKLIKYSYLDERIEQYINISKDDKDTLKLLIQTGIFMKHLLQQLTDLKAVSNDNTSDIDKIMVIYIRSVEGLGTPSQVMALMNLLGAEDTKYVTDTIIEYKMKLDTANNDNNTNYDYIDDDIY